MTGSTCCLHVMSKMREYDHASLHRLVGKYGGETTVHSINYSGLKAARIFFGAIMYAKAKSEYAHAA